MKGREMIVLRVVAAVVVVIAMIFFVRQGLVNSDILRETMNTDLQPVTNLGVTHTLEVLPLYDKTAGKDGLASGAGVSYLVRTDQAVILLDAGNSAADLASNMQSLGVNPADIQIIVISHKHPDHVGGQDWWNKGTFAIDSSQVDLTGKTIYVPEKMSYPGALPQLARLPVKIAEGVGLTGTLSFAEVFPFSILKPESQEQSLVINLEGKGLILITGCGHPGLERITNRAEAAFEQPMVGVIGGLHYGSTASAELYAPIKFLRTKHPVVVSLSPHDSSTSVLEAFRKAFPEVYQDLEVGIPIQVSGSK